MAVITLSETNGTKTRGTKINGTETNGTETNGTKTKGVNVTASPVRKRVRKRRWLRLLLAVVVVCLFTPLLVYLDVQLHGGPILSVEGSASDMPVAIVFGAGYNAHGLSPILADRVKTGVDLYKAGKVRKLLMTGDNGQVTHNEPAVMCRAAMKLGVPRRDIVLDFAGFRTYDSLYRARAIFGIDRAILVTQAYHLPRALYTGRALGLKVVGVAADHQDYGPITLRYQLREVLADENAWIEAHFSHPLPRRMGKQEPIFP